MGVSALTQTGSVVSADESNAHEYILLFKKLLLSKENENITKTLTRLQKLLSFIERVFRSRASAEAFLYFCLKGAATAWILQSDLDMPEATAYRALKRLRAMGLIEPATRISKRNAKGGPRPAVWALLDSTPEDISGAIKLHHDLLSPKFRLAKEAAQTIMDNYLVPRQTMEIGYREILTQVKKLRIPFNTVVVTQLAAKYLGEKGVKVCQRIQ